MSAIGGVGTFQRYGRGLHFREMRRKVSLRVVCAKFIRSWPLANRLVSPAAPNTPFIFNNALQCGGSMDLVTRQTETILGNLFEPVVAQAHGQQAHD